MNDRTLPIIIQGGMGAGVSSWSLARAVSISGQLGVVSGTGIDLILTRRLQLGDPGGHLRRALSHFPIPSVAERILRRYFVPGGKPRNEPFRSKPIPTERPSRHLVELLVASNFAEVFLAREGHSRPVGINYLEKIQLPTLPSLYGAMLAGVKYVLVGAGIPRAFPGVLDRFSAGRAAELPFNVQSASPDEEFSTRFDPRSFWGGEAPVLERPDFLAIISSATLGAMLKRKSTGRVDGFVVEGWSAGGHNAPPRGGGHLSVAGEPIYSERDIPDLEQIRALGLPFWLAGSYADPAKVTEALQQGAAGVQVGTVFAYCAESGLDPDLKARVLGMIRNGRATVFADPVASPTGFPFKLLQLEGTISDPSVYEKRVRVCDLGYLRQAYKRPDGTVGWRCSAEPVEDFILKGGDEKETRGRKCICNGLLATIGLAQVRGGDIEKFLVTSGDDVAAVARFLESGAESYTAAEVVERLLRDVS